MKYLKYFLLGIACTAWSACPGSDTVSVVSKPIIDADGAIHVPAFSLPPSRYMSEEAKRALIGQAKLIDTSRTQTGVYERDKPISQRRAEVDESFRPIVERARARYPVNVTDQRFGGVSAQVVTPKSGISVNNRDRVLINLHGGGFIVGSGLHALAESIPVAARARIKVVSVDYRMAPEYHFPAASEDVAAVYSDLLKEYRAKNIGLYGCSAGGILSAMAIAWLHKQKLPSPGAIGIFSAGAFGSHFGPPMDPNTWGGDSSFLAPALSGAAARGIGDTWPVSLEGALDYLGKVDKEDPLASPALSREALAQFPPTLLITGTRAWDMSAAVQTQRLLTKAGTRAELHLWDAMGHCFFLDVDLPESQEAYDVIAQFFDTHLGG